MLDSKEFKPLPSFPSEFPAHDDPGRVDANGG